MFKLNLKIAFRNLLKNKGYTAINIIGLALGLAGFIFILLYVNHEKSYNTWDKELEKVYQVQELDLWSLKEGRAEWQGFSDSRLIGLIRTSLPDVKAITTFNEADRIQSVIFDNEPPFLQEGIATTDQNFFSVFPFRFIYGNAAAAFNDPDDIVISEAFAKKHYGNMNPVGKTIKLTEASFTETKLYRIAGVVANPVTPTTINFTLLIQQRRMSAWNDNFMNFRPTYVKISDAKKYDRLNTSLQKLYEPFRASMIKKWHQSLSDYTKNDLKPAARLKSLYSLHQEPLAGKNWFNLIKPIILLSSLLLFISMINFINMFTAQAVERAKEVGIKKVIGANRLSLIKQFLLETAMQCFCALILSVVILELLLPYLNGQFSLALSITGSHHIFIIISQMTGLVISITFLSGIYPSLFLSAYEPHKVLKGNLSQGKNGLSLRGVLVGLQFVIAVGFLIGIMIISSQIKYMETHDPGFNATAVINIENTANVNLSDRIRNIDGVKYVGSNNGVVSFNQHMEGTYKYKNESKELTTALVSIEGLQAIGAELLKGRLFDDKHSQDTISAVIINESLEKMYGGKMLGEFMYINNNLPVQVIGVIKDIQVAGFETKIEPVVYTAAKNNATGYPNSDINYLVKFDQHKQQQVLAELNKLWRSKYPAFPIQYTFLQDDLEQFLVAHKRFKEMVKLFSALAISLSLIGLFSLAAFMTRRRTKEIAIRKVLGAGDHHIFLLLNKGYFWLMIAANIIAWPLIYIAVNHWLAGFAYRIEIPVFPFIVAFMVSLITTVITVSLQVYQAIKESPVNALKYE